MQTILRPPVPRIPLMLLAGLLLQAAGAIWWAAQQGSDNRFQDLRLNALESRDMASQQQGRDMLDRLARIEERLAAQTSLLADVRDRLKER